MPGRSYAPKALLRLTVVLPTTLAPYTFDVLPVHARHARNDHNHADELDCTVSWLDTGVDPRWIASAICEFYLWDEATAEAPAPPPEKDPYALEPWLGGPWADPPPADAPFRHALRFVGRLVEPARHVKGDSLSVDLKFHDYTSFFLVAKPLASDAVPSYAMTLQDAWNHLCASVPGVADLADNLVFRGLAAPGPVIGSAVAKRFAARTKVDVKPDMDAWAVWQKCVGTMGLISFFELDQCIVTTATDLYTSEDPPKLIWGQSILDCSERRNNDRANKGIMITSFDPIGGRTLEAQYNPFHGNLHKLSAKAHKKPPKPPNADKEFDVFSYPGITDQAALDALAKRVFEERSRQELEGTVATAEMFLPTAKGDIYDLLSLPAGAAFELELVDTEDAKVAAEIGYEESRVGYLLSRGYSASVATIIAGNCDAMVGRSTLVHTKSVTTTLTGENDGGGSFRVEIAYINKINPTTPGATMLPHELPPPTADEAAGTTTAPTGTSA